MSARPRVVVAGGGFAGLETAFMLRQRAHEEIDIALVSDRDRFLFKPNTIYIPFGAEPDSLLIDLEHPLKKRHISFFQGRVKEVDPDARHLGLEDGTVLPYDALVLATGAAMRPQEVPGLAENACTIWTPEEMLKLRDRLLELERRAKEGAAQKVLFLVPPNNKCSGPLYEIVFMLETWARRQMMIRDQLEITYSTYEHSFIQAFGPRLHEVVTKEFKARGIEGFNDEIVDRVEPGVVHYADGSSREYDLLISFPPYVASIDYEALPRDGRGFITTLHETRQVDGHPEIYAPGDGGDFPVKQAFLAFLQADATAEHIGATFAGKKFSHPFDPVSMCVMEMFDTATFAQVPLRLTGDPLRPVEVRPDADGNYKVGVSPAWRLGKKLLGFYLPMRFHAGEPFHAGLGWQVMDVGLKGMSGVLAD
jgi:sulfide:quinone oxidoreductase